MEDPMRRTMTPVGETALFFALTLGVSWLLWIPLVLLGLSAGNFAGKARGPAWVLVPFLLGGFMPSIVALVLTAVREGKSGLRQTWRRLVAFRIGWRWYLAAIVLVAVPTAGQILIHRMLGGRFDLSLFVTMLPSALPLIVIGPLSEEIGWRGYALDRLQGTFGAVGGGLIVGIGWAAWHLPLFFWAGTSQHELGLPFAGFLCGVTATSLLMTWLHNNTAGSIWTAVFFHWLFTYAGTVVATGVTRSVTYNWLEYAPYIAAAVLVLAIMGLGTRKVRGAVVRGSTGR
jgi:membrane protease YdiL (CAAX protease family)